MPQQLALFVFIIGITSLFLLDRERERQASAVLWLPFIWVWVSSSRSITEWLAILQTGRLPKGLDKATMYAEGSPLDRNVLIVLMVIALVVLVKRMRLISLLRANALVFFFLLYAGASAFWSDFPEITIRRWFKAVACVLFTMLVLSERDRDASMRRLFVWAGFLLIPLSILFIKYYPAIGRMTIIVSVSTWVLSPTGVATHKNSLGEICQFYGIVFVWHFLDAYLNRDRPHRLRHLIAHGIALGMVVWLFVQANSVTAQSSFLLVTILLLATSFRAVVRRRWLVHLVFTLLIAIPFATLFLGIGSGALESMGRDSTLTGRTEIWARVIDLVPDPVLGTGFESFWLGNRLKAMDALQQSLNEAHNGFLEIWASLGWIGVLLFAAIVVKGYGNIMTCFDRNPSAGRLRLAYFMTVLVSSFTEAAFRTGGIFWMAFLLVTMTTPEDRLGGKLRKSRVAATSEQEPVERLAVAHSSHELVPEAMLLTGSSTREVLPVKKPLHFLVGE